MRKGNTQENEKWEKKSTRKCKMGKDNPLSIVEEREFGLFYQMVRTQVRFSPRNMAYKNLLQIEDHLIPLGRPDLVLITKRINYYPVYFLSEDHRVK